MTYRNDFIVSTNAAALHDTMNGTVTGKLIRCRDCRYFGKRMINGYWSCGRKEGCVETIPEGFCGWAVRRGENVE